MKIQKGIGASGGIAVGKAVVIGMRAPVAGKTAPTVDTAQEIGRLEDAISAFCRETEQLATRLDGIGGGGDILRGHILLLRDPYMISGMKERIAAGKSATAAVGEMCEMFAAVFESAEDELTRQRAADVRDIGTNLRCILEGGDGGDLSVLPPETVLVLDELTPSMTARLDMANLRGVVTARGGLTSHCAILARNMHLPAVLSVENAPHEIRSGQTVALDGRTGEVVLDPDEQTLADFRTRQEKQLAQMRRRETLRGKRTVTADGIVKELFANIGSDREIVTVREQDAEGVGLFRTEFLFMDQPAAPDEETQLAAYRAAATALEGRPLVIRTLDVGGDKNIPYLGLEREENPFLGLRAIRYCLAHPELFLTQLRAILRASAHGKVRILLPMITCVEELTSARALIEQAKGELRVRGMAFDPDISVGVMIETPAACRIADLLAARADFFSIGTNDLTQYLMAADRGNAAIASLYSVCYPAVLRTIRHVIDCAHRAGIAVGMCGESAADPRLIPLLIAFGLDEFSVNASEVLGVREQIRRWTREQAEEIATHVMSLTTESEIRAYLTRCLESSTFADPV